ncbi:MAG: group II intron maturase-specific domain-containing protein [Limnochordia bacterium]
MDEPTPILRGRGHYFKLAQVKNTFEELDGWIRRQRTRPPVECRSLTYERSLPEVLLLCTWTRVAARLAPTLPEYYMNRRGTKTVCPVVWEEGGSGLASYPII